MLWLFLTDQRKWKAPAVLQGALGWEAIIAQQEPDRLFLQLFCDEHFTLPFCPACWEEESSIPWTGVWDSIGGGRGILKLPHSRELSQLICPCENQPLIIYRLGSGSHLGSDQIIQLFACSAAHSCLDIFCISPSVPLLPVFFCWASWPLFLPLSCVCQESPNTYKQRAAEQYNYTGYHTHFMDRWTHQRTGRLKDLFHIIQQTCGNKTRIFFPDIH